MREVPVANVRLDSLSDGRVVLTIELTQPVAALAASIFAHNLDEASWFAAIALRPTENPLVWAGAWEVTLDTPALFEVGNFSDEPTMGSLAVGDRRWLFLKPETGDTVWPTGERAKAELARVEASRERRFNTPLVAPGATPNAPKFLILAIADNLYLTQPQRVPGIALHPISTELGEDTRTILNRILREHRIMSSLQEIPKDKWLRQTQQDRPAVQIQCRVQAENRDAAGEFGRDVIKQLLGLMTLRRGAAAQLIAGVCAEQDEADRYLYQGAWIEHSGYHGNLLGGFIAGEDARALQAAWSGLQAHPRAQLWVSLYADAVRDPRWEYQFFRCFALLEAIAETVVRKKATVIDEAGNPRPLPDGSGNYSTKHTQGKVYTLLLGLSGATANDQLWDEVGHWAQVRNDVAHEGTWQAPHAGEKARHAAAHAFIACHGQDGTFESGTQPFVDKIRDSVKRTLYATINGTL
ncbi:Uncharacterised protein [Mycobacteroides abscessus subsp. abscessus]|nr:Uncharacterised protein [Mycobacteroides abscessus subsp. abscessus]SII21581.1 Uncharacterised protein [Mycobacteroides abscessus subsp. abscessus]SII68819.1 Uncharacterised protein [Mycobacteroides abscessus subsp. abscessus]SIJ96250.1 Uncharacterised protein [Mycobacteroides abscessus subsp. abscessus]SIK00263.1 Uncharacterised protein [Mycobacteroides abscessus subsp. abscessus]